jgi:hypothetical protein
MQLRSEIKSEDRMDSTHDHWDSVLPMRNYPQGGTATQDTQEQSFHKCLALKSWADDGVNKSHTRSFEFISFLQAWASILIPEYRFRQQGTPVDLP